MHTEAAAFHVLDHELRWIHRTTVRGERESISSAGANKCKPSPIDNPGFVIGRKLYICRQPRPEERARKSAAYFDADLANPRSVRLQGEVCGFAQSARSGWFHESTDWGINPVCALTTRRQRMLEISKSGRDWRRTGTALQCHHPEPQLRPETPERGGHSPRRATQHRARLLGAPGVGGRDHR